jgi:hypothetical protein
MDTESDTQRAGERRGEENSCGERQKKGNKYRIDERKTED